MKILIAALAAAALAFLPFASQELHTAAVPMDPDWCSRQVTTDGSGPCT
jgi:hypothetical protein